MESPDLSGQGVDGPEGDRCGRCLDAIARVVDGVADPTLAFLVGFEETVVAAKIGLCDVRKDNPDILTTPVCSAVDFDVLTNTQATGTLLAMEQEQRIEAAFLIPIREDRYVGNDRLHPHIRWQRLTRDLYHMFEGWSRDPGLVEGVYKSVASNVEFVEACYEEISNTQT